MRLSRTRSSVPVSTCDTSHASERTSSAEFPTRRNTFGCAAFSFSPPAPQTCAAYTVLHALSLTPWYVWLLAFGSLLLANLVDSLVKRHDRKGFEKRNRYMHLEFTTKLGMHSPIEPGWKTPKSFLDEQVSSVSVREPYLASTR